MVNQFDPTTTVTQPTWMEEMRVLQLAHDSLQAQLTAALRKLDMRNEGIKLQRVMYKDTLGELAAALGRAKAAEAEAHTAAEQVVQLNKGLVEVEQVRDGAELANRYEHETNQQLRELLRASEMQAERYMERAKAAEGKATEDSHRIEHAEGQKRAAETESRLLRTQSQEMKERAEAAERWLVERDAEHSLLLKRGAEDMTELSKMRGERDARAARQETTADGE